MANEARRKRLDPFENIKQAQDLTRESVIAQGELLRPELLSQIGDTLGGLNSIGALRSGGTEVALQDISRNFTTQFGNIATAATAGASGVGLEASRIKNERREARLARKAALIGAIGSVVGAGVGFAVGGPPGAVAGAQAGSSIGKPKAQKTF